jgi:hypothetical protein
VRSHTYSHTPCCCPPPFTCVCAVQNAGTQLFPGTSRNNFCYVCVDPLQHLAKVWYHAYMPYW